MIGDPAFAMRFNNAAAGRARDLIDIKELQRLRETARTYKARLEMGNLGGKQEAESAVGPATYVSGKAGMAGRS